MIQLNPQYEAIFDPRCSTFGRLLPKGRKIIDEHFCYFDDMYSPEYSLQWIYEDIMKYDIDQESRKLLEEGHKEILQSECYEDYGYPSYIDRFPISVW